MSDAAALTPTLVQMRVLRSIAFAGAVGDESEIFGFDAELGDALETLAAGGLIETDGIIAPTPEGIAALEAWYARDRADLSEGERDRLIDAFRPLDLEVKRLASAWQDAEARDNWDARLSTIEALSALHDGALDYLRRNAAAFKRFAEYEARLTHAHDRVIDGETDHIASIRLDSYHTIWFILHEDLLRLLERERDPE